MSATFRNTVPLRAASDGALWMVACTLRTDLADKPPFVPLPLAVDEQLHVQLVEVLGLELLKGDAPDVGVDVQSNVSLIRAGG